MLKNILILALLFFWNRFYLGIPDETIYAELIDFCADRQTLLLATALGAGGLLVSAGLFSGRALYRIPLVLAVLTENACQLLIMALGFGQAYFYVVLDENLYSATSYLPTVLLFLLLFTAVRTQRIIDFNHPLSRSLYATTYAVIAAVWPVIFIIFYDIVTG